MGLPAFDAAEAAANAAFDALMRAMAEPGTVRDCGAPAAEAILGALVDRECTVHGPAEMGEALARSGAEPVALEAADYVFLATGAGPFEILALKRGSDLYPDDAATAVLPASLADGTRLRLTGPGIPGAREVFVGGVAAGLWQARTEAIRYPMGPDLFLIDGARVMALPRSTTVEPF